MVDRVFVISAHGSIQGTYSFQLGAQETVYFLAKSGNTLIYQYFDPSFFNENTEDILNNYLVEGIIPVYNYDNPDRLKRETHMSINRVLTDTMVEEMNISFEPFFYNAQTPGDKTVDTHYFMKTGVYQLPLFQDKRPDTLRNNFFLTPIKEGGYLPNIEGSSKYLAPKLRNMLVDTAKTYNRLVSSGRSTTEAYNNHFVKETIQKVNKFSEYPLEGKLTHNLSDIIAHIRQKYPGDHCHFVLLTCRVLGAGISKESKKYFYSREFLERRLEMAEEPANLERTMSISRDKGVVGGVIPQMIQYMLRELYLVIKSPENSRELLEGHGVYELYDAFSELYDYFNTTVELQSKVSWKNLQMLCDESNNFIAVMRQFVPDWRFPDNPFTDYYVNRCLIPEQRAKPVREGQTVVRETKRQRKV